MYDKSEEEMAVLENALQRTVANLKDAYYGRTGDGGWRGVRTPIISVALVSSL